MFDLKIYLKHKEINAKRVLILELVNNCLI